MQVNWLLKIPPDVSHPLAKALGNVFQRNGEAHRGGGLHPGESCQWCAEPCLPCSQALGWATRQFAEMQAWQQFQLLLPHSFPKWNEPGPKERCRSTRFPSSPRRTAGNPAPRASRAALGWVRKPVLTVYLSPMATLRTKIGWPPHSIQSMNREGAAALDPVPLLQTLRWAESVKPGPLTERSSWSSQGLSLCPCQQLLLLVSRS